MTTTTQNRASLEFEQKLSTVVSFLETLFIPDEELQQQASELIDKLARLEEELHKFKLEALRSQIDIGIKQLESSQYTEYNDESLSAFFANIKARGQEKLADSDSL
ncbi:hypothetical protein LC574_24240, partial [Nostoc sp. CHAB 5715]|nr:hypothetical protein [Nostoc sp. CHAB 5715]